MKLLLTLLALCLGAALAGPVLRGADTQSLKQCSPTNENHKFKYPVGKSFVYNFGSSDGFNKDKPEVRISGKLNVLVSSPCLWLIGISKANVVGPDGQKDEFMEMALNKSRLLVKLHGGAIVSVLTSSGDSIDGVNIKTAILSALQNTMDSIEHNQHVFETDILGACPTSYTSEKLREGEYTIRKTKNLKGCQSRQVLTTGFFGQNYYSPESTIQNVPLLSEEHYLCEQHLKDGIIHKVSCEQKSVFKPFSGGSDETQSYSKLTLALASIEDGDEHHINLDEFTHPSPPTLRLSSAHSSSPDDEVDETIRMINRLSKDKIRPVLPSLSHKLVHLLRVVGDTKFEKVYENEIVEHLNPFARDIILDALPAVGTPIAIKTMIRKIDNKEVTDFRIRVWVTSLAFTPNVTAETLEAILPLMERKTVYQNYTILGVTSMGHQYLADNPNASEEDHPVQRILKFLGDIIGHKCETSEEQSEREIKIALKGFGNLGRHGDFRRNLIECTSTRQNPLSLRVEAIKALRRMPCSQDLVDSTLHLFLETSEDEEIRIEGYLKTIRCPSREIVQKIIDQVTKEEVIQVKVFVYTHIKNLNESTDPLKKDVKEILQHVHLDIDVPTDLKKYSQNIEWSLFYEKYNMGVTVDKNLIYSSKSMVPRALNVNLTANLFGRSLNILEVGARAENVDHYLRNKFGPNSKFSRSPLGRLFALLNETILSPDETTERSPSDDDSQKDMSLVSIYTNFFGNELLWKEIKDLENGEVDHLLAVMKLVNKLSQRKELETAQSVMFLDTSMTYGTVTGAQQTISVNGTGILAFKVDGKFDIRNLDKGDATIEGSIVPSAAVEVDATWKIHSGRIHSGVKVKTTLHSSANISGHIRIHEGRILEFKVDLPKDNTQIISFSTEFFSVNNVQGEQLLISTKPQLDYTYSPLGRITSKYLGSKAILRTNAPRQFLTPDYFLNGPVRFDLTLLKVDPLMKGYELEVTLPKTEKRDEIEFKFLFDTPESLRPRRLFALLQLKNKESEPGEKLVRVQIESQFKNYTAHGSLTDRHDFKHMLLEITDNNKRLYDLDAKVDISRKPEHQKVTTVYNAKLDITPSSSLPRHETHLVGHLTKITGKKGQISYNLKALPQSEIQIVANGVLKKEGASIYNLHDTWRLSNKHRVVYQNRTYYYHGLSERTAAHNLETSSHLEYQISDRENHTLSLITKSEGQTISNVTQVISSAEVLSTQFPDFSSRILWQFVGQHPTKYENTIRYSSRSVAGKYQDETVSNMSLEKDAKRGQPVRYKSRISVHSPHRNIESSADFEFAHSQDQNRHYEASTVLRLSPKYEPIRAGLKFVKTMALKTVMEVSMRLDHPAYKAEYQDKLVEIKKNVYEGHSILRWNEGKNATMDYSYALKEHNTHNFIAEVKIPSRGVHLNYATRLRLIRNDILLVSTLETPGFEKNNLRLEAEINKILPSKLLVKSPLINVLALADIATENRRVYLEMDLPKMDGRKVKGGFKTIPVSPSLTRVVTEIDFNKLHDPNHRFEMITDVTKTKHYWSNVKYSVEFKGKYRERPISGSGEFNVDSPWTGPHKIDVEVKNTTVRVQATYKLDKYDTELALKVTADKSKLETDHYLKYDHEGSSLELTYRSKHQSESVPPFEVELSHYHDLTSENKGIQTKVLVTHDKQRLHSLDGSFNSHEGSFTSSLKVDTPYVDWKSQEIKVNGNTSSKQVAIDGSFKSASSDVSTLGFIVERQKRGIKLNSELKTSNEDLKNLKFDLVYVSQLPTWQLESNLHRDGDQLFQIASMVTFPDSKLTLDNLEMKTSVLIKGLPHIVLSAKIVNKVNKDYELRLIKDLREIFLTKLTIENKEGNNLTTHFHLSYLKEALVELTADLSKSGSALDFFNLKTKGLLIPEVSTSVRVTTDHNSFHPIIDVCAKHKCFTLDLTVSEETRPIGYLSRHVILKISTSSGSETKIVLRHTWTQGSLHSAMTVYHNDATYEQTFSYKKTHGRITQMSMIITLPKRILKIQFDKETSYKLGTTFVPNKIQAPREVYRFDGELDPSSKKILADATLQVPRRHKPYSVKARLERGSESVPMKSFIEIDLDENDNEKLFIDTSLQLDGKYRSNSSIVLLVYKLSRRRLDLNFRAHAGLGDSHMSAGMEWSLDLPSEPKRKGSGLISIDHKEKQVSLQYEHPGVHLVLGSNYRVNSNNDLLVINITSQLNGDRNSLDFIFNRQTQRGFFRLVTNKEEIRGSLSVVLEHGNARLSMEAMHGASKIMDTVISLREVHMKSIFLVDSHIKPEIYDKVRIHLEQSYAKLRDILKTYTDLGYLRYKLRQMEKKLGEYLQEKIAKPLQEEFEAEVRDFNEAFGMVVEELNVAIKTVEDIMRRLRETSWDIFHDLEAKLEASLKKIKDSIPDEIKDRVMEVVLLIRRFVNIQFIFYQNEVALAIRREFHRISRVGIYDVLSKVIYSVPAYHARIHHSISNAAEQIIRWANQNEFILKLKSIRRDISYTLLDLVEPILSSTPYRHIVRFLERVKDYVVTKISEKRADWKDTTDEFLDILRNNEDLKVVVQNLEEMKDELYLKIRNLMRFKPVDRITDTLEHFLHVLLHVDRMIVDHSARRGDLKVEIRSSLPPIKLRSSNDSVTALKEVSWGAYDAAAFISEIRKM